MPYSDPEKQRAYRRIWNRAWRKAHPEIIREFNRAYYLAHKDEILALNRAWKKNNPERVKEIQRTYIKAHPEKRHLWDDDPIKVKARKRVQHLVARGKLTKPKVCPSCKTGTRIEGHHEDYLKPEEVTWLCNDCHARLRSPAPALPNGAEAHA